MNTSAKRKREDEFSTFLIFSLLFLFLSLLFFQAALEEQERAHKRKFLKSDQREINTDDQCIFFDPESNLQCKGSTSRGAKKGHRKVTPALQKGNLPESYLGSKICSSCEGRIKNGTFLLPPKKECEANAEPKETDHGLLPPLSVKCDQRKEKVERCQAPLYGSSFKEVPKFVFRVCEGIRNQ